ncbi:MAG: ATP-binding protein, partial [Isosphaeraceae bacterium]
DVTIEEAAEVVNQATDLQSRIKEARDSQRRIAVFRQEAAQFASDVCNLCQRVASDLNPDASPGSSSVEIAAGELLQRFRIAQETSTAKQALIRQRESELTSARNAEQSLSEASLQLAVLCQEARCALVDDLPRAEQRSRDALELRDRLKVLDEQIQQLGAGEPFDAFRQAALALDLDRLPDQLQALADEISQLDADRGELNQVLGREQQVLRQMDGSSRAAEAAEQAEELKARLAVDVEEYARLRLAAVVLHEAIDRYRQRSQGPVLDRASGLFAQLTLGSFNGLKVDYDDHDQAVLRAVRPGGTETVGIAGLSEGSADQLYLALRLASLGTYLESHEPIPLVVDDILIQFDDDRATAALRALAELSRRTQIVLFSHHEHVCRLAQACVDPDRLLVHRLSGRARVKVIEASS